MGLIAIASAKGSPGATTAALLFGALWPRDCLVAELDPSGSDVALRMPGPDGRPLNPQAGLVGLAAAGRKSMHPGLLRQHTQRIVGGLEVITGVSAPEQTTGFAWPELANLFRGAPGVDVIGDLGRIGGQTPQNAMLYTASIVVMVVDVLPSNVVHLRERLVRIQQTLGAKAAPVHVVVVAPPKRARAVREAEDALNRSEAEVEAVHHLAHDDVGAGFFLGQVNGRAEKTALVRSATPIVSALAARTSPTFIPAGDELTAEVSS